MIAALRTLAVAVALAGCGGPAVIWSGHTPDRRRTLEVIEDDGRQYVVLDGQRRAAYRAIAGWSIEISDDGHVAFAARVGARWVVVHDGRAGEPWDAIGELLLAPGDRLTYLAERAGRWHVVTAGVAGPAHDAILAGSLTASPDGRRVAYAATDPAGQRVFVDGEPGPRFDGVGALTFTADGAHVVHVARLGRAAHVVVDHTPGPAWSAVDHLTLAPAGHRIAYAARDGDDWRVIAHDAPGPTDVAAATTGPAVDAVRRITFSPDGARVAWLATVDDRMVLAVDDTPVAAAPSLRDAFAFDPVASPSRLAHVAPVAGGGEHVVVDGVAGPTYDEVGAPVFSADGRVAYSARRGPRWCIVAGGRELRGGDWVGDPVWAPDGRRLAYLAQRGRAWFAIVDGAAFRFDLVMDGSLAFSSSSAHWSVVAGELATETLYFAVDGTRRVPLSPLELYSAATRGNSSPFDADPAAADLLRRWSEAEANRAE